MNLRQRQQSRKPRLHLAAQLAGGSQQSRARPVHRRRCSSTKQTASKRPTKLARCCPPLPRRQQRQASWNGCGSQRSQQKRQRLERSLMQRAQAGQAATWLQRQRTAAGRRRLRRARQRVHGRPVHTHSQPVPRAQQTHTGGRRLVAAAERKALLQARALGALQAGLMVPQALASGGWGTAAFDVLLWAVTCTVLPDAATANATAHSRCHTSSHPCAHALLFAASTLPGPQPRPPEGPTAAVAQVAPAAGVQPAAAGHPAGRLGRRCCASCKRQQRQRRGSASWQADLAEPQPQWQRAGHGAAALECQQHG